MSNKTDELKEQVVEMAGDGRDALEAGMHRAEDGIETLRDGATSRIVPYVVGALGIGIVIGLLLPREVPSTRLLDGRLEELRDLVGTLKKRISSTAEDSYDDVSSALTGAVKKARKRFHLS